MKIVLLLLSLLKLLGIVLLALLVVISILILVVLFVPIRYNIEINKSDKLHMDIEASWLVKCAYFRYRLSYKGKKTVFKVLGKTLYKDREVFSELKEAVEHDSTEPVVERHDNISKSNKIESQQSEPIKVEPKEKEVKQPRKFKAQYNAKDNKNTKKQKAKQTDKVIENIVEDIGDTVEQTVEHHPILFRIKQFWDYPDRKKIVWLTCRLFKKLLKALMPKQLSLDVEYGCENPAYTGYVLAFSSILVLQFGDNIKVRGNFQQTVLNGNLNGFGKLYLIDIIGPLIQYILSRPIFKIIWRYFRRRKDE